MVHQLERLAVCFCFFLCFVLFWFFFSGASCWWLDCKELFIVLLKKVRSEEKGGLSTLTCTAIRLVRQLVSFNVCFCSNSVSFFEGRKAGGSVNSKKTL